MSARKRETDTELLELGNRRTPRPKRYATSSVGMVSTAHYLATQAGSELLSQGGNAVDAAVAAAFALGVCEPAASGLGGQTMIVLYDAEQKRRVALDGSSRAPHRIEPGELLKRESLRGHKATTVPSTPAVLAYTLERYGTKSLAEALAPSIRLAKEGCPVTPLQNSLTKRELKHLKNRSAAPIFLKNGERPYSVGARLRQPVLAQTLTRLAEVGVEDFYQGELARLIHEDMVRNDGLIRDDDLAQIPWPVEREPISTNFEGLRVFTLGPPGAGRVLVQMLNILAHTRPEKRNLSTPQGALLLAEVIRHANRDRQEFPFDRHLHHQERSEEEMLDPLRAREKARHIRKHHSGHGETTHLSVMDRAGNMVALTQSIERVYGSFEACPELGFLYNNYMSAYEMDDITHPYYLRPNAVPWASVAPTLVFRGRHPWLSIGSPGSERIASSIVQVLLRLRDMNPFEAVDAPRLHCSAGGKVSLEASRIRDDIPERLAKAGFEIDERDPYSFYLGCVQMVMRGKRGQLIGVADPRRDGSAGGPKA